MPFKPVISIEVNDDQFKRFADIFGKYQEKLKDTDAEWARAGRTMNGSFGQSATEHLHAISRSLDSMNPSIRGIGSGLIGLTRNMGLFGGVVGVAASGVGLIARGIEHAAADLFKLTAVATGAVYAFDRLGNTAMGRISQARAINTSTGRLAAFNAASRDILPAGLPASISSAVTNLNTAGTVDLALARAGLTRNQAFEHPINASLSLAQEAHRFAEANRGNVTAFAPQMPMMQAFAALGLNQADVIRLGRTSAASLKLMSDTVRNDARKLQINPHTFIQFQRFHTDLAVAGRTLETDLINRLRTLGPSLGKTIGNLTARLVTLLNDVLSKGNLDALKTGLGNVDKFLQSGGVTKALNGFKAELNTVETGVAKDWPKVESAALSAASAISTLASDVRGFENSPFVKWLSNHVQSPAKTAAELRNPEGWKQAFPWAKRVADMFTVHASRIPHMVDFHDPKIAKAMHAANAALGIPHFMQNLAMQESGGNADAVNARSGAEGLFQDLPSIVRKLRFDPFNPASAIAGNLVLAESNARALGARFTGADAVGRLDLLAAAHDEGVTRLNAQLQRYGSLGAAMPHLPAETRGYVARVNRREERWAEQTARSTASLAARLTTHPRVVYSPQIPVQSDIVQQVNALVPAGGTP